MFLFTLKNLSESFDYPIGHYFYSLGTAHILWAIFFCVSGAASGVALKVKYTLAFKDQYAPFKKYCMLLF